MKYLLTKRIKTFLTNQFNFIKICEDEIVAKSANHIYKIPLHLHLHLSVKL
jgi:hypothetical protein